METSGKTFEEEWYQGDLKKAHDGYVLDTGEREMELEEEAAVEQAWHDLRNEPQSVMVYGAVSVTESLTGTENYSMQPERVGYVLEQDFDGRDVIVSGYDLVFLDSSEVVYDAESFEELRENVRGWFPENEDEKLETLTDLKLEKDYWPWGSQE